MNSTPLKAVKDADGWYSPPPASPSATVTSTPAPPPPAIPVPDQTPVQAPAPSPAAVAVEDDGGASQSRWAKKPADSQPQSPSPSANKSRPPTGPRTSTGPKPTRQRKVSIPKPKDPETPRRQTSTSDKDKPQTATPTLVNNKEPEGPTDSTDAVKQADENSSAVPKDEKKDSNGSPSPASQTPKKQYPDRNRVLTGGKAKEKLTPEELEAKMAAMKLQNEKLRQKRAAVEADESSFAEITAKEREEAEKALEEERRAKEQERREKLEKKKRAEDLQASINRDREAAAARKLEALQGRAWDKEKLDRKAGDELNYPSQSWTGRKDQEH